MIKLISVSPPDKSVTHEIFFVVVVRSFWSLRVIKKEINHKLYHILSMLKKKKRKKGTKTCNAKANTPPATETLEDVPEKDVVHELLTEVVTI